MSDKPVFSLGLVISLLFLSGDHAFAQPVGFLRGDATANGKVDISDPVLALGALFARGQAPICWNTADANDDERVDVSDPIYTLLFLFAGGDPPPSPFPNCGVDPTGDSLIGCTSFPPCTSPEPPTELVATSGPGEGEITLEWRSSPTSGTQGYEVFTSTSTGDPNPDRVTAEPVTQTSLTHAGLEPGTTHYYILRAIDQLGNVSSFSNEASATALLPGDMNGGAHHVISLLVLYPQPAGTHLQRMIDTGRSFGETTMDAFLDRTFEHVDSIYANSGLPVSFEVVHSEFIDWSDIDEDEWRKDLSLALMNSELNNSAYVPYLQRVEALRDAHGADVVIYWRESGDDGPSANGAGSIGGGEDEAYIHMTYFGMKPRLLAHETGHLLGARHENGYQGEAEYSVNGDEPQQREYRTIMTVAFTLGLESYRYLWAFSSDGGSVDGNIACGFNVIDQCEFSPPIPIGDSEHDSVSIISQMAPVVAAFR